MWLKKIKSFLGDVFIIGVIVLFLLETSLHIQPNGLIILLLTIIITILL